MTEQAENQVQTPVTSDKELNFRALESRYQRQLEQERAARLEAERIAQEASQRRQQPEDDDEDDSEPYVDHKKLNKKLSNFGQRTQSDIQKSMEMVKHQAKEEIKQEMWLENHGDFYDVMQNADKLYAKSPKLAESILRMPEGFERQKLVYLNIKELGLDRSAPPEPSIQQKIDANRKSPYYQPSGVANSPYAAQGDFSPSGQKNAYEKMQQLKAQLRI